MQQRIIFIIGCLIAFNLVADAMYEPPIAMRPIDKKAMIERMESAPPFWADVPKLQDLSDYNRWPSHELDSLNDERHSMTETLGTLKRKTKMDQSLQEGFSPNQAEQEEMSTALKAMEEAYRRGYFGLNPHLFPLEYIVVAQPVALMPNIGLEHIKLIYLTLLLNDLLPRPLDDDQLLIDYVVLRDSLSNPNVEQAIKNNTEKKLLTEPYLFLFRFHQMLDKRLQQCGVSSQTLHAKILPQFRMSIKNDKQSQMPLPDGATDLQRIRPGAQLPTPLCNLYTQRGMSYSLALNGIKNSDGETLLDLKQGLLNFDIGKARKLFTAFRNGDFQLQANQAFAEEEAINWLLVTALAPIEKRPELMSIASEIIFEDWFHTFGSFENYDLFANLIAKMAELNNPLATLAIRSLPFSNLELCLQSLGSVQAPPEECRQQ